MEVEKPSNPVNEGTNGSLIPPNAGSSSTSSTVTSKTRRHRAYFTPEEVSLLSQKQGTGASQDTQEKMRQLACTFMEAVGQRMGFPRKTIATSQTLYHRFRLFFPLKDFSYFDVAQATLYVSAKMHDTIKKPQDILDVGYTVRYPHLVNVTGVADIDSERKAEDRRKLLAIERLVLETICFNFTIQMAFPYVIKFSKNLHVSKELTKLAWRLCADSHRTVTGLQYPPHAVALASIYLAGLLASFEVVTPAASEEMVKTKALVDLLSESGDWEEKYLVKVDDLQMICHSILDLLVSQAGSIPQSYRTSPTTPSSPSPYPSPRTPNPFKSGPSGTFQPNSEESHVFTASHLTRLKIALRKQEATLKTNGHTFRKRSASQNINEIIQGVSSRPQVADPSNPPSESTEVPNGVVGKNEGTVRFLFGPDQD
ncbi:hypothetical protein M408DRAFT_73915 [Serendipita vermifera MAFF 305830]|uniref:Cyclin-like domain-containing protein n=1 Tax=Serendipita vermifera MAFF 305830 TaxID=933852 RepID=A0A0C2X958_SERVB|nr:hypothetical protein M408DRAFT_73915 [Serendipita vermifera MAFF 305830]